MHISKEEARMHNLINRFFYEVFHTYFNSNLKVKVIV